MTRCKAAVGLVLVMLLTACSNNPLMRTSKATSSDAARAIEDSLADAESRAADRQAAASPTAGIPSGVTDALLPSLTADDIDGDRFDISARDLAAPAFFQALVEGSDYNVVVHPRVGGSISLNLKDVTVPEVMDIAGDLYDLDIQRNGRLYRVLPGGIQTRIFPIDYLHLKRRGGSETQVSSGSVSAAGSSSDSSNDNGGTSGSSDVSPLVGTRISTTTESDFWGHLDTAIRMIVGSEGGRQVITNAGSGLVMVRAPAAELRQVEDYLRKRARVDWSGLRGDIDPGRPR